MIKVGFVGAKGKMNTQTINMLLESHQDKINIVGLYEPFKNISNNDYIVLNNHEKVFYSSDIKSLKSSDILVDFSHFSLTDKILDFANEFNKKLIIGTTNLNNDIIEKIKKYAENIAIFYSSNMSYGINALLKLLPEIVKIFQDYDIEIVEFHHNRKKDAPSGTAKTIAQKINGFFENKKDYLYDRTKIDRPRKKDEIGISTVRLGGISGIHSIYFGSEEEIIEIKHTALSRKVFSAGTIKAIYYLNNKRKGLFNYQDLLENK